MTLALITGIEDFIGSHLVDYLIGQGWQVWDLDNFQIVDKKNIHPKVKFKTLDLRKKNQLTAFLKAAKPRYVFHIAAIARTLWTIDPMLYHETNITGTLNVLLAAIEVKEKKVIFISSNVVYTYTPYLVSNIIEELYMRLFDTIYSLPTVSLRFSNTYGSLRQSEKGVAINCIASLRKSKRENSYVWITGDGKQSRDFNHVEDIVHACLLAVQLKVHGKEINICTEKNFTLNQITAYFNCPIKYVPDQPGDVKYINQDPKPV